MEVNQEELYYGLWCTIYAYICAVNVIAMIVCWHKVRKPSFWCCYTICIVPSAVGYGFLIACQTGNFGGEFCEVKLL